MSPSYTKNTSCFENILCTILKTQNKEIDFDYTKMFINHWDMNYDENYDEIGDRIFFYNNDFTDKVLEAFQYYYGMKCREQILLNKFDYDELKGFYHDNDYVMLYIDSKDLKNLSLYKRHLPHYILVTDIRKNGLCCIDYTENIFLDINHYNNSAIKFIFINVDRKRNDKKIQGYDLEKRISTIVCNQKMFMNINKLARDFSKPQKIYTELNNIEFKENVLALKLIKNLGSIGASRYLFNSAIQSIDNIPLTQKYANHEFLGISESWFTLIKKIVKFKFNYNIQIVVDVQNEIFKLAEREQQVAKNLLNLIKEDSYENDR